MIKITDKQATPRSIEEATVERQEMVALMMEIEDQLRDPARARDHAWRRQALWRKSLAVARAMFLRDWLKVTHSARNRRREELASSGDLVADPVALVASLRRELDAAYVGRDVPDRTQKVLKAARYFVRQNVEAEAEIDAEAAE